MDAYYIVGNPHTRKSSVIRCLTGCFNRSVRDIELINGKSLRVYARVGSLQDTRTSPEEFLAEVTKSRCDAVICCLAASSRAVDSAAYPEARLYLSHFDSAGWKTRGIAVLGQNEGGIHHRSLRQFPQAGTQAINVTAHGVRKHFGWL